jgi:hypothetical protein
MQMVSSDRGNNLVSLSGLTAEELREFENLPGLDWLQGAHLLVRTNGLSNQVLGGTDELAAKAPVQHRMQSRRFRSNAVVAGSTSVRSFPQMGQDCRFAYRGYATPAATVQATTYRPMTASRFIAYVGSPESNAKDQ